MKNIIKSIGLFSLILFSFFYSEKVMEVVKEKDSLMIEIKKNINNYKVDSIDAIIEGDTIIPGISGKTINIDKSYKKMKKYNIFNESLIEYDIVKPSISIDNNLDKYIINGRDDVYLIFVLDDIKYINEFLTGVNDNKINIFIDNKIITNNLDILYKINNYELYNYGNNGNYTNEVLLMNNNIINNIANNKSNICLNINKDNNNLNICKDNNMYSINPLIIESNDNYNNIKKNIENGSIIYLDINKKNIEEINNIINYIKKKGYKLNYLSELVKE